MEQLKTTIVDYGNGIYAIDQQMVRAFLIVGSKKALLLDTCAIHIDIQMYIKQITDLPVTVILTHGDIDHIGNLLTFEQIYCNENDHLTILSNEPYKSIHLLNLLEGDIFDIGTRKLKVILTPGHTAGSVCLLDEENKILFAGDTISYGPIFMFGDKRNLKDYLESLRKLKTMALDGSFNTVYCCHNTCPISKDTVDDLIMCTERIINHTIEYLPAPIVIPSADKIFLCKYGKSMILISKEEEKDQ